MEMSVIASKRFSLFKGKNLFPYTGLELWN